MEAREAEWRHTLTWQTTKGEITHAAGHDSTAQEVRKLKQLAAVTVKRCEMELEARGEPT